MRRRRAWMAAMATGLVAAALAQGGGQQKSYEVISPVFHQLVAYSLPGNFQLKPETQANAKYFLRENVLNGETPARWTQMITFTGAKGAALAGMTAPHMMDNLAAGFEKACPATFAAKDVGSLELTGRPAHLSLVSCGSVADAGTATGADHSETALLLTVAGDEDMYSLQWAARGPASEKPLPFDDAVWEARFRELQPIRICAEVPGEKMPFPSCLGSGAAAGPQFRPGPAQ